MEAIPMARAHRSVPKVAAAASAFFALACGTGHEPRVIRNVVLVSIDTLGALHSSAYGYDRRTTPNLDRVAQAGTLFERAYTQQVWTLTSHVTMMTGLYPQTHGASQMRPAHPGATTLAEILKEAGFDTAAFAGPGAYMKPYFGLGRGFDRYENWQVAYRDDNAAALQWIAEQARAQATDPARRFFLFIHYFAAHSDGETLVPYDSPPRYRQQFLPDGFKWDRRGDSRLLVELQKEGNVTAEDQRILTALYDAGVLFTDETSFGPLLSGLSSFGFDEDTLVIVTADHGEEIFEHGSALHQQPYEETARVPLVLRGPGIPVGLRIPDLVELVDLMPTILGLLSLPVPAHVQGRDLAPLLRGKTREPAEVYVDGLMGALPHARARLPSNLTLDGEGGSWSYVARVTDRPGEAGGFAIDGAAELYRLDADPRQQQDVAAQHPELVRRMERKLLDFYTRNAKLGAALAADHEVGTVPLLSEEEIVQLKRLGYGH